MDHVLKCKTIQLKKGNIGENLWDLGLGTSRIPKRKN